MAYKSIYTSVQINNGQINPSLRPASFDIGLFKVFFREFRSHHEASHDLALIEAALISHLTKLWWCDVHVFVRPLNMLLLNDETTRLTPWITSFSHQAKRLWSLMMWRPRFCETFEHVAFEWWNNSPYPLDNILLPPSVEHCGRYYAVQVAFERWNNGLWIVAGDGSQFFPPLIWSHSQDVDSIKHTSSIQNGT